MPRPRSPRSRYDAFQADEETPSFAPWPSSRDAASRNDSGPPEDEFLNAASLEDWRNWLVQWEHRQRVQLQFHEEIIRDMVRSSLKDFAERGFKVGGPRSGSIHKKKPLEEKQKAQSKACEEKQKPALLTEEDKSNMVGELVVLDVKAIDIDQQNGGPPSKKISFEPLPATTDQGASPAQAADCESLDSGKEPKAFSYHGMNEALVAASGHAKHKKHFGFNGFSQTFTTHAWIDHAPRPPPGHITPGEIRHCLWLLVHHPLFAAFSGGMIGLYTIVVGMLAHVEMQHAVVNENPPNWRLYVDMFFTTVFLTEVLLNMLAQGILFWRSDGWRWNVFDFIVAVVGLVDAIQLFDFSVSYLRILRTLRSVRVLRMVRIFRFFKELRLMVDSILCCMASLTWAFTLLVAVMYIFSVLLLQGASDYLQWKEGTEATMQALKDDFGGIHLSIYSLAQAVSGGRSWGEYAAPFIEINPLYGLVFTIFVVFVIFGVLNILTGIFVESTSSLASYDKELVVQEEMSRNESVVGQIRELFYTLDEDKSGTLSYKELKNNLKDERVRAYFAVLQMDVSEAYGLFQLLDRDESGEVSIEEFIMSCMRLKGAAKSIDLAGMLFESKRFHNFVKGFMLSIRDKMFDMHNALQDIHEASFPHSGNIGACDSPRSNASREPMEQ